jgi:hypothetical protein
LCGLSRIRLACEEHVLEALDIKGSSVVAWGRAFRRCPVLPTCPLRLHIGKRLCEWVHRHC